MRPWKKSGPARPPIRKGSQRRDTCFVCGGRRWHQGNGAPSDCSKPTTGPHSKRSCVPCLFVCGVLTKPCHSRPTQMTRVLMCQRGHRGPRGSSSSRPSRSRSQRRRPAASSTMSTHARPTERRSWQTRVGCSGSGACRRRPRVGYAHRQTGVDLSHNPASW